MSVVAVLPVKRFDRAKARLAEGGLRPSDRVALATGMFTDVIEALGRTENIDDVVVVTSEKNAEVLARSYGNQVISDGDEDGHSEAAQRGIDWAVGEGAFHALLLPGDAPLLDAAQLDHLVERLSDEPEVVIVPDRHGTGTNALFLTPPDVIRPSFGPGSRERHEQLAREAGAAVRIEDVPCLHLDVDTCADLDVLGEALGGAPKKAAVYTRDALARVRR
ncbi:MAG: 2-phospho-L-lactate guanylyltransferase [Solirubrobacteraceae bacterium]|jgi:2-phospho-L-lactate guanylyltransferase|nr:2-phospho-L-lactate guanylyltransferase [Solirubrobacteraceae bacterium]